MLHFTCPKCGKEYTISSYWKWVFTSLFHNFNFKQWRDYRYTKCPHCKQRSFVRKNNETN
jgi:predicted RNA-binding Zn-ribbon protein involved in translation (DUF1610 family)